MLSIRDLLERRLSTVVWRNGLAVTPKQARQFVVHGHIAVAGKKVDKPSYLVEAGMDGQISYYGTPLILQEPKKASKVKGAEKVSAKDTLKKAFEESKGAEPAAAVEDKALAEKESAAEAQEKSTTADAKKEPMEKVVE